MKLVNPVDPVQRYMVRLPFGCDLLAELSSFCEQQNIRLGRISGIGAVRRATIAYYDQAARRYGERHFTEPMELLSLVGNISLKDAKPFVHAHIILGTHEGRAIGGHLCAGTEVFAGECIIEAFRGPDLVRQPDAETGLSLWVPPAPISG
jgi:predicted DNA-binding protein with PD1-like motif